MDILPGLESSQQRRPRWVYDAGTEPDPRFSLSNERTLLSWIRTATGFAAGGGGVLLIRELIGPLSVLLSIAAFSLSLAIVSGALLRWAVTERALRLDRSLPAPTMALLVTAAVAIGAILGLAFNVVLQSDPVDAPPDIEIEQGE